MRSRSRLLVLALLSAATACGCEATPEAKPQAKAEGSRPQPRPAPEPVPTPNPTQPIAVGSLDRGPWTPWTRPSEGPDEAPTARLSYVVRGPTDTVPILRIDARAEGAKEASDLALAEWDADLSDLRWVPGQGIAVAIEHGRGDDGVRVLDLDARRFYSFALELGPLTGLHIEAGQDTGAKLLLATPAHTHVVTFTLSATLHRDVDGSLELDAPRPYRPDSATPLTSTPPRWPGAPEACQAPAWHPSAALFGCWAEPGPIFRLVAADGRGYAPTALRGLFHDPGEPAPVRFSPDGDALALTRYVDTEVSLERVALAALDDANARELVVGPQVLDFAWAPASILDKLDKLEQPGLPVPAPAVDAAPVPE